MRSRDRTHLTSKNDSLDVINVMERHFTCKAQLSRSVSADHADANLMDK